MENITQSLGFMLGHNLIGQTTTGHYYRGGVFDITLKWKSKTTNPDLRKDNSNGSQRK
jgi:hypothetical protein